MHWKFNHNYLSMPFQSKKSNCATLTILLFLLIVNIILLASTPPVSRDALTHHLAVPKIWLEKGLFKELPSISFSYYPMNLDLIYLIPLYLGNDVVPKYIHFAFALFSAFLIYNFLNRRLNTQYGLLGALFFLSIPVIVRLSTMVYVDLGLVFFSTASLFGLIEWMGNGFRIKTLIVSSIWCGLALGTKYNGLIVFFLLSCLVPILYLRKYRDTPVEKSLNHQFSGIGCGVIFIIVSLMVYSPWMIRNTILTGNPVYPLYNGLFNQAKDKIKSEDVKKQYGIKENRQNERDHGWKHFAVRKIIYGESWWQIGLIPFRIFLEGRDDNPKHFDGKLSPFLIVLPLLLLLPGSKTNNKRTIEYRVLLLFSIAYIAFVFFQVDMRIRWICPIVPPLVVLSIFGLERLATLWIGSNVKWKIIFSKIVVIIAVTSMLLLNTLYIKSLYNTIDPFSYLSGKIDRESYIKKFRPEYEVINFANRKLAKNATILCLFIGDRIYYFEKPIFLDINLLKQAVMTSDTSSKIRGNLQQVGITHIILRYDLTDAWIRNSLDANKRMMIKEFIRNYVRPIHSYGGYGLFELVPPG